MKRRYRRRTIVAAMSRGLGMVVGTSVATILITKLDVALRRGQRGNWGLEGTGAHMVCVGCLLSG